MADTNEIIKVSKIDSPAVKMTMEYEDGTVETYEKGFIVIASEVSEEDTEMTVNLLGCNISGKDMIDMAWAIAAPIAAQAMREEGEE